MGPINGLKPEGNMARGEGVGLPVWFGGGGGGEGGGGGGGGGGVWFVREEGRVGLGGSFGIIVSVQGSGFVILQMIMV